MILVNSGSDTLTNFPENYRKFGYVPFRNFANPILNGGSKGKQTIRPPGEPTSL
jgi:hypothetical protein